MNKKIIISLFLLFALANCQCPNGYKYASKALDSFDLPESNKYYQVAMVSADIGSYVTDLFKRNSSQIDCKSKNRKGSFADTASGDANKICCISKTEYNTSIAGFEESTELAKENEDFTVTNSNNWFGLVEYKSSRGNSNYKFLQGGPWGCNSDEFGDPDVGYLKTCNFISTKNALFNSNYSTLIGNQHDQISTTSYSQTEPIWVGYGADGKWQATSIYLINNDYKCDDNMFTNSYKTKEKQCYMYQSNYISLNTPQGSWQNVASGQDINQKVDWTTSYTNTVTHTDTLTQGISATITAGVEYGIGSASVSVTASALQASSNAYSDSINHSETMTCSASCSGDTVQYLWQWNIDGVMSTPEQVENGFRSQTCNYYCTDTAEAPKCAYAMKWDEEKSECVNNI